MLWFNTDHMDADDYKRVGRALEILGGTDWANEPLGRKEIDEHCRAQILGYETEPIEGFEFEVHHHRLDIHYVVSGEEVIEVSMEKPRETEYLVERDLAHVELPRTYSRIVMHAGDVLVIGMDEPHRTNGVVGDQPCEVKKIVLKMSH